MKKRFNIEEEDANTNSFGPGILFLIRISKCPMFINI
jgi:hypothetical protein